MTHPTDDSLKPCPFCGSQPEPAPYVLKCVNAYCEAQPSVSGGNDDECATAWNKRALLVEQARTEPVAEFSARVSMLLAHAKRGDSVSHDEVLEIAAMDPDELRRRAVVARDWHRAYQQCLDGLPLKAGMHHTVPAGCWFPRDIRMLVEQLLATQPLKAEQAKDAAEDAPSDAELADTPTPKPQGGLWTLTAPDGRTYQADSPLRCCGLEQRERVPADVAMARIFRAASEPDDSELLDWLDSTNKRFKMGWKVGVAPAGNCSVQSIICLGNSEPVTIRAAIRAAAEIGKALP